MPQVSMWDKGREIKTFNRFDLSAPEWHAQAACTPEDIHLLSPPETEERESVREEAARLIAGRRICQACPVWPECRQDAAKYKHQDGIWGGQSEYERPYTAKGAAYKAKQDGMGEDADSREYRIMQAIQKADYWHARDTETKGAA